MRYVYIYMYTFHVHIKIIYTCGLGRFPPILGIPNNLILRMASQFRRLALSRITRLAISGGCFDDVHQGGF